MSDTTFDHAVAGIVERDARFHPRAYFFVRLALDHTVRRLSKPEHGPRRHVTGQELLEGFRELALREFGPLARTVLAEWGIRSTEDVGAVVFNLVGQGVMGRKPEDSAADFAGGYRFDAAFDAPFLPSSRRLAGGKKGRVQGSGFREE